MKLTSNLFSPDLVQALGWTLLHSLWQGAVVAVLLSVVLLAMRKCSSAHRYIASTAAMLFLVALVAATFIWQYSANQTSLAEPAVVTSQWQQNQASQEISQATTYTWQTTLGTAAGFFDRHVPLLVIAWVLGAMFMLLRMLGGLVFVQRMRSHKLLTAPAEWAGKLNELSERAGVTRAVQLAESALVKVPLTIGVLKPIILLPIGTIAGIPVNQIEAILAHELAHIGRKDFLFNLLQSFVEVLFFYHPAMWWIGGCLRTEREHCCDDIAIALCGDLYTFASALASIEEFTHQPPALAMALGTKKGTLLTRIKRLLGQNNDNTSFGDGFWSGCVLAALLLVTVLALLFVQPGTPVQAAIPAGADISWLPGGELAPAATVMELEEPTTGLEAGTLTITDTTGKATNLIIIKNKKGKIVELYVDGRKVPDANISDYSAEIESTLAQKKTSRKAGKLNRKEEKAKVDQSLAVVNKHKKDHSYYSSSESSQFDFNFYPQPHFALPPMAPMPPMDAFGTDEVSKKAHEKEMKEFEKEMAEYKKEMGKFEMEMKEFEKEMEKLGPEIERQVEESFKVSKGNKTELKRAEAEAVRAKKEVARAKVEHQRAMEQHKKDMVQHEIDMARHAKDMEHHAIEMAKHKKDMALLEEIKAELVKDKLIDEKDEEISFRIDNSGMYLNKVKQPDTTFWKYENIIREKTGKKKSELFNYHFEITK